MNPAKTLSLILAGIAIGVLSTLLYLRDRIHQMDGESNGLASEVASLEHRVAALRLENTALRSKVVRAESVELPLRASSPTDPTMQQAHVDEGSPTERVDDRSHTEIVATALQDLYESLGYSNLSSHDLINLSTSSRDPMLKGAAFVLYLDGVAEVDPTAAKEACFAIAGAGNEIGQRSLLAARGFAKDATAEDLTRMKEALSSAPFPTDWAASVSLAEMGDPSFLDDWTLRSLEELSLGDNRRTAVRVVEAAGLYNHPLQEDIALAAAKSPIARAREAAIPLLVRIGSEACLEALQLLGTDPDRQVGTKARLWKNGIKLSLPTDRR